MKKILLLFILTCKLYCSEHTQYVLENTENIDRYLSTHRNENDLFDDTKLLMLELIAIASNKAIKEAQTFIQNNNTTFKPKSVFAIAMKAAHTEPLTKYKHIRDKFLPEDLRQILVNSGNELDTPFEIFDEKKEDPNYAPTNDQLILMIQDFNTTLYDDVEKIFNEYKLCI